MEEKGQDDSYEEGKKAQESRQGRPVEGNQRVGDDFRGVLSGDSYLHHII